MGFDVYVLTPKVRKRLESLGFDLRCHRCGEPFEDMEKVSSKHVQSRVRRFYHQGCWASLYYGDEHTALTFDLVRQRKQFKQVFPGYHRRELPSHVTLKKGILSNNPGAVLCPLLARGGKCTKHTHKRDGEFNFKRPQLLKKHHANPNLQLWQCAGCSDFLLRVEKLN